MQSFNVPIICLTATLDRTRERKLREMFANVRELMCLIPMLTWFVWQTTFDIHREPVDRDIAISVKQLSSTSNVQHLLNYEREILMDTKKRVIIYVSEAKKVRTINDK